MKKKLILIAVAVITACMLAGVLSACNNATTQGTLSNFLGDHNSEEFVYDVLNTYDGTTGTYTVSAKAYDADATVEGFGLSTLQKVKRGVLISTKLSYADKQFETGCYYNLVSGPTSYMQPAATYRVEKSGEKETFRLQGTYDGGAFKYERYVDGKKDEGSMKIAGTCFDNNQFHQALRTVTDFSAGLSLTFSLPTVTANEATTATLLASCNSTEKVKTAYTDAFLIKEGENAGDPEYPDGMTCYKVTITRSTVVSGRTHTLYYAAGNIPVNRNYPNVFTLKNVLIKIEEPFEVDGKTTTADGKTIMMAYSLKSASLE